MRTGNCPGPRATATRHGLLSSDIPGLKLATPIGLPKTNVISLGIRDPSHPVNRGSAQSSITKFLNTGTEGYVNRAHQNDPFLCNHNCVEFYPPECDGVPRTGNL